jgi:hypothetical protein
MGFYLKMWRNLADFIGMLMVKINPLSTNTLQKKRMYMYPRVRVVELDVELYLLFT